jgi:adenylate kinase
LCVQVILIGPPGAGKGTQAKMMQQHLQLPHVSSGDLLREAVKRKSEIGLQAKKYMDRGELVPDELVVRTIEERVRQRDCRDGFIIDGFPRNVPQAEVLRQMLAGLGKEVDHVVSLTLPREEIIKRLSGRRTCRECGAMYHIIFDPPVNSGVCNKCNGELYQRDDDQEDTIGARLDVYQRETAPLLQHYGGTGLLRQVDAVGSRDQIFERILEHVTPTQ